jgi:hypothetical protein
MLAAVRHVGCRVFERPVLVKDALAATSCVLATLWIGRWLASMDGRAASACLLQASQSQPDMAKPVSAAAEHCCLWMCTILSQPLLPP